jgi:phage terminase large subunit-like protein
VWTSVYAGVMNMQLWQLCADPMLEEVELAGCECWIAVDLASKSDLCAAQRLYRKDIAGKAHYYLFGSHWLPEEAVEEPGPNHAHLREVAQQGPADADGRRDGRFRTDHRDDHRGLQADQPARGCLRSVQRGADDAGGNAMNITAVEFIQTPQNFAVPLDELLSAVKDGRFHHDANEITTWCVSNMVARPAKKGLVAPIKQKPHQKIDSAIAICMAYARASQAPAAPDYQMLFV